MRFLERMTGKKKHHDDVNLAMVLQTAALSSRNEDRAKQRQERKEQREAKKILGVISKLLLDICHQKNLQKFFQAILDDNRTDFLVLLDEGYLSIKLTLGTEYKKPKSSIKIYQREKILLECSAGYSPFRRKTEVNYYFHDVGSSPNHDDRKNRAIMILRENLVTDKITAQQLSDYFAVAINTGQYFKE